VAKELSPPKPIYFVYILSNSGQSSGGHTALLIGDTVYHFQYNFKDKILHLARDPWEEFVFHYGVWENRSMHLLELDIPVAEREKFKNNWDETFIIQKKWIQNLDELRLDEFLIREISQTTENQSIDIEIAGLGYFTSELEKVHTTELFSTIDQNHLTEDISYFQNLTLDIDSEYLKSNLKLVSNVSDKDISNMAFVPPLRIDSIYKKIEYRMQKIFFRNYFLSPKKADLSEFISLDQKSEFALNENELASVSQILNLLEEQIKICLNEKDSCTGDQEMVLLARYTALNLTLKKGFFYIPKKANYRPFYYQEIEDIPNFTKTEKLNDAMRLFTITKNNFLRSKSEIGFIDWETEMAKIDAIQRESYDIVNFETLPLKKRKIKYSPNNKEIELSKNITLEYKRILDLYETIVPQIYSYHLIFKNCTNEIFRYHNEFYNQEEQRKQILGGTIPNEIKSLSFVPFVATQKVKNNYRVLKERSILSYRLLKKQNLRLGIIGNLKEDFLPLSTIYEKNPYDQEYLFFTDDTIILRPIYGLTNLTWGIGVSALGLFYLPFDRGKKVTNGVQSVFFSFPELVFFNIRKGYFPYVTQKDLPESYYEQTKE